MLRRVLLANMYAKIYVCPNNSYVCPSFSYIQFSILTYCFHFLFLTLFSFYWPNSFSTIIVAYLIKCFSTEVAESTELTPNQANSAFETIGVTILVPNKANQGMIEWIGNKMVNSSQSVLNCPSECANAHATHMPPQFKPVYEFEPIFSSTL